VGTTSKRPTDFYARQAALEAGVRRAGGALARDDGASEERRSASRGARVAGEGGGRISQEYDRVE